MSSNDLSNKNRKKQSKRRRKSRFHGNQFSKKTQPDEPNTGRITTEAAIEQDQDVDEVWLETFKFYTAKSFHKLTV